MEATDDISIPARAARLKAARAKHFASASKAARALGINAVTARAHESGQNGFPVEYAKRYADAYGVSVEWLLTGEGSAPDLTPPDPAPSAAALWLAEELARTGRTQTELANFLDIDASSANRAVKGKRALKADEVARLQEWFQSPQPPKGAPLPSPSLEPATVALRANRNGTANLQINKDVPMGLALKVLALLEAGE